ncbi:hypothetical protein D3C75_1288080 [compost metagenome]
MGASVLAFLLLGEELTGLQWSGGLLVMGGLAVYLLSGRKKAVKVHESLQSAS